MTETRDSDVRRRNAAEFGWHVGYYNFILTVLASDDESSELIDLTDEERNVFDVLKDRLDNFLAFFAVDATVSYPNSRREARPIAEDLNARLWGTVHETMRIRQGSDVSSLFELGRQSMTYGLMAGRTEPEIREEMEDLATSIRRASRSAGISSARTEALLREPEQLSGNPGWFIDCILGVQPSLRHRGRIFICHASDDKTPVLDLYHRLKSAGHDPWLDKEDLLPGQEWGKEIPRVIRSCACVIVVLSQRSVQKRGYVQKKFKLAMDVMNELPEGQIFVIPVLLNECIVPESFTRLHWIRLDENAGFEKLLRAINNAEDNFASANESETG